MSLSRAPTVVHPGYVPGNYYALSPYVSVSGGAALAANTIRTYPIVISKPLRVAELAARVTTTSAGGNFQLAIYANNPATARPTGTALCSTGNLSTASGAAVSGAVTAVTLAPGTYWFASNQDNAAAAYQALTNGTIFTGYFAGSATLANVTSGASGAMLSLTVAQAFNTWPDLTSGSFTESTTNLTCIAGFAKAA
jgi:hypothetical protein